MDLRRGGLLQGLDLTFTDPKTVAAAQYLSDSINQKRYAKISNDIAGDFSAGGIIASTIASTGDLSGITENSTFDFGTAFLPAPAGVSGCPTGGAGLAIPARISEDRKVNALKFIAFITDAANTAYFSQNVGYMPVRKSAQSDPSMVAFLEKNPQLRDGHRAAAANAAAELRAGVRARRRRDHRHRLRTDRPAERRCRIDSRRHAASDRAGLRVADQAEAPAVIGAVAIGARGGGCHVASVTFAGGHAALRRRAEAGGGLPRSHGRDGEFMVLVGPSGCGKSTSLRMVAGLESVESGAVLIDDVDVIGMAPKARDVAMVFQNYALYPNMTVADNMGFALRNAGMSKADTGTRVLDVARMLELENLLDRKPAKLSGGQRQRVAMGRAIVRRPKVFCMDEPLSNLDAKLRVSTRAQIAAMQRELGVTTLYVTHDQVEAMTMGHRVAVLDSGVLQQVGTPREIYSRPANLFVASFMGSPQMCLIDGRIEDGIVHLGGTRVHVPAPGVGVAVVVRGGGGIAGGVVVCLVVASVRGARRDSRSRGGARCRAVRLLQRGPLAAQQPHRGSGRSSAHRRGG